MSPSWTADSWTTAEKRNLSRQVQITFFCFRAICPSTNLMTILFFLWTCYCLSDSLWWSKFDTTFMMVSCQYRINYLLQNKLHGILQFANYSFLHVAEHDTYFFLFCSDITMLAFSLFEIPVSHDLVFIWTHFPKPSLSHL